MKKVLFVFTLALMFGAASAQKSDQYNLADRDRTLPFVLKDNGEIVQGSMVVGKYKINDLQSGNKIDKVDIAEFYLISDVIICKATKVADKDNEYQIYTYKDSKTITYTTEGDQLKSLTQFLVLKGYL